MFRLKCLGPTPATATATATATSATSATSGPHFVRDVAGVADVAVALDPILGDSHDHADRDLRRQQALTALCDDPRRHCSFVVDEHHDYVIVMMAVRTLKHGIITGEMLIERARWNRLEFFRLMQENEHSAAN